MQQALKAHTKVSLTAQQCSPLTRRPSVTPRSLWSSPTRLPGSRLSEAVCAGAAVSVEAEAAAAGSAGKMTSDHPPPTTRVKGVPTGSGVV